MLVSRPLINEGRKYFPLYFSLFFPSSHTKERNNLSAFLREIDFNESKLLRPKKKWTFPFSLLFTAEF